MDVTGARWITHNRLIRQSACTREGMMMDELSGGIMICGGDDELTMQTRVCRMVEEVEASVVDAECREYERDV